MKSYVGTTGVLFALLVVAHFLRIYQEGQQLAKDPSFLLITAVVAGLAVWAWWLIRDGKRSRPEHPKVPPN
jgi:hypothetical protein